MTISLVTCVPQPASLLLPSASLWPSLKGRACSSEGMSSSQVGWGVIFCAVIGWMLLWQLSLSWKPLVGGRRWPALAALGASGPWGPARRKWWHRPVHCSLQLPLLRPPSCCSLSVSLNLRNHFHSGWAVSWAFPLFPELATSPSQSAENRLLATGLHNSCVDRFGAAFVV